MKSPRRVWAWLLTFLVVLIGAIAIGLKTRPAPAKEPVELFLDKLRGRGYFDTAREYLESLKTNDNVSPEIKQTIPFEQGKILVEESRTQPLTERLKTLEEARAKFDEFVKQNASHDLAGIARIQMGNVLLERGRAYLDQADRPANRNDKTKREMLRGQARGEFEKAKTTFDGAVKDFQAKVDKFPKVLPKQETKQREARSKARRDLIEAKFYHANTFFQISKTYDAGAKEHKQVLTDAATHFHKIYTDYRRWMAGLYAGMWEGRSYQEMGDTRRALGLYMELLNQPDNGEDIFRELKAKTLRFAMEAWNDDSQRQFQESEDRGEKTLRAFRPNEEREPYALAIAYLTAQALHLSNKRDELLIKRATGKATKTKDPKKGPNDPDPKINVAQLKQEIKRREPRIVSHCRYAIRGANEFAKEAKDLLALYKDVPERLPTTFAEAMDRAQSALAVWEQHVADEKDAKDPAEKKKLAQDVQIALKETVAMYRLAVALKDSAPDVNQVNDARYALSFFYYRQERFWDSAIMGEFLAQYYPQYKNSQQAAWFAFAAWLDEYNNAKVVNGKKPFETGQLVRVSNLITQQWPDGRYAVECWMTLGDLSIREQKPEEAKRYYERIPKTSEKRPDADLRLGQALWGMYLGKLGQDPKPPETELKPLMTEAVTRLSSGVADKRKSKDISASLLGGELALAQIALMSGTPADAKRAIDLLTGEGAFLPLYKAGEKAAQEPAIVQEAHKVLLRAYVTAGDTKKALEIKKDVEEIIKKSAKTPAAAQAALTGLYIKLSREIDQQLTGADAAQKQKLTAAFDVFLRGLLAAEIDFNTTHWIAETYLGLADALDRDAATKSQSPTFYAQAEKAYQKMKAAKTAEKATLKPGPDLDAVDSLLDAIATRLGKCQRGAGQYGKAINTYIQLLFRRNALLEAQREANLTFKEWAASGKTEYYSRERGGYKHQGKPIVWGWALMSRRLQPFVKEKGKESLRDMFFEARYELSRSYLDHAKATQGKEQKDLYQRGYDSIDILYRLYKDEMKNDKQLYVKFNAIMSTFQSRLGKPGGGLRALEKDDTNK